MIAFVHEGVGAMPIRPPSCGKYRIGRTGFTAMSSAPRINSAALSRAAYMNGP